MTGCSKPIVGGAFAPVIHIFYDGIILYRIPQASPFTFGCLFWKPVLRCLSQMTLAFAFLPSSHSHLRVRFKRFACTASLSSSRSKTLTFPFYILEIIRCLCAFREVGSVCRTSASSISTVWTLIAWSFYEISISDWSAIVCVLYKVLNFILLYITKNTL